MAKERDRRMNAGAKMASLLHADDIDDEFYQSTYGGFYEADDDAVYSSPDESESDDSIDSDLEEETAEQDEAAESDAEDDRTRRRAARLKAYKEPSKAKKRLLSAKRGFVETAGKRCFFAPRRGRSEEGWRKYRKLSQEELLAEAKLTEEQNLQSLERFRQLEVEEKKRRQRAGKRKAVDGPVIKHCSLTFPQPPSSDGRSPKFSRNFLIFPDDSTFEKCFPWKGKGGVSRRNVCVVTGRVGRYRDPLTELPYADSEAFRRLRNAYQQFLDNQQSKTQTTEPSTSTNST